MCEKNPEIILDKFGDNLKCPIITKVNISATVAKLKEGPRRGVGGMSRGRRHTDGSQAMKPRGQGTGPCSGLLLNPL